MKNAACATCLHYSGEHCADSRPHTMQHRVCPPSFGCVFYEGPALAAREEVLDAVEEALDTYQDVVDCGDGQAPNKAMMALTLLQTWRQK